MFDTSGKGVPAYGAVDKVTKQSKSAMKSSVRVRDGYRGLYNSTIFEVCLLFRRKLSFVISDRYLEGF